MGQGASKATPDGQHVLPADHTVRLSQHFLESLQQTPESDNTRSKDAELKLQQRIRTELRQLDADASRKLAELEDRISSEPLTSSPGDSSDKPDLGRETVQREIDELRSRLEQRKLRSEVINDKGVEQAKSAVLECLRNNASRSLNCYQEVDDFRREVARLERGFLERHLQ